MKHTKAYHGKYILSKNKKPKRCLDCNKILKISAKKSALRCSNCSNDYYKKHKNDKKN